MVNWLKRAKNALFGTKKSTVVVGVEKDTELYNYVIKKMAENDSQLLRDKIEDLEKVIYSMSTKLSILTDAVKKNSEYTIHLATIYEEVQNELEKEYGLTSEKTSGFSEKKIIDTSTTTKQTKKTDLN